MAVFRISVQNGSYVQRNSRNILLKDICKINCVEKRCFFNGQRLCSEMDKFQLPKRYQEHAPNVWAEYARLAYEYKPLNLGTCFPDFPAPKCVTDALAATLSSSNPLLHQYTRGSGHPRLVEALSKLYSQILQCQINAKREILVTCGSYSALYSTIQAHVDEGDEVIIIEPFLDCYESMVKIAGGVPRFIPLKPKNQSSNSSADWVLDKCELEKLFNKKTKMIIVNSPQNPLGKVYDMKELTMIAELCQKNNVLCLSDEIHEWFVYEGCKHVKMCTLPGMWDRTITIGSAELTFSVTGWKTGWVYGPDNLMNNVQKVHQNTVNNCTTPIQEAIAVAIETELPQLGSPKNYFCSLPQALKSKRDFMGKFLTAACMKPIIPQGGPFMITDWTAVQNKVDLNSEKDGCRDYRFTKWMAKTLCLLGIPVSAFYSGQNKKLGENYVRYCFNKKEETLRAACRVLNSWKTK